MAEVILDPTTRAPSPAWQGAIRLVAAALVAKLAIWLTGAGVKLDATDQIALVTIAVAITGAVGTEARNRGWPVIRLLFFVPLCIGLGGCATWGQTTPSKVWSATLTSYELAARGMAVYCAQPVAEKTPCVAAANATHQADLVILATQEQLEKGTIQDAELAVATSILKMTLPLLSTPR